MIYFIFIESLLFMVITKKLFEDEYYIGKISKLLQELWIQTEKFENYLLAFVHRSLVNERPDFSHTHNERLEFLWDAVLELIITKRLFQDYPKKPEWELTDLRSSIVKWKNLAIVARNLWFQDYLILGKWEELTGGRNNDYLLANCVEAFLWAMYLDIWFEGAEKFTLEYIYSQLENILNNDELKDYKSLLQEYTQRIFLITPEYKVLDEAGMDHEKVYTSWVFLKEHCIWKWTGSSKKKSQESAAHDAFLRKENIILPR